MSGRQQEINWTASEQRRLLDECNIPDVVAKDGVTVKAGFTLSVLRKISEFAIASGECYASLSTIADSLKRSRRHVCRAIAALEMLSLITCETRSTNHYRVVWTEVAVRSFFRPKRSALSGSGSALPTQGSALATKRSALEAHNGGITEDDIISEPEPDAETEICDKLPTRERTSPYPNSLTEESNANQQQVPLHELVAMFERVPELRAAKQRIVSPLAPGRLLYGVFAPLREPALSQPTVLVEWFRRQLGTDSPVCEGTEAHLLLIFAAARYAMKIPADMVRRNRVAVFVFNVSRRKWRTILRYVPECAPLLDDPHVRGAIECPEVAQEVNS